MKDVPPGVYTITGYIFSPPYNGWEVRPGLVKVKDAQQDPVAAVVARVQEALFHGQGRRVRACLDVPEGTRLRTIVQVEGQPGAQWSEWGSEQTVATGEVARCFVPPDPALAGSLRLRFDLVSPAGDRQSFYSPDTLLILGGEAPCSESDTLCCPAADGGELDAAMQDAAAIDATDAEADRPPEQALHARDRDSGGCAVTPAPGTNLSAPWLLLGLLVARPPRRSHQNRDAQ